MIKLNQEVRGSMESTARSLNWKTIIIYGLVAIGLLVLVIGGIIWAKSQSNHYANQQTTQNQPVAEDNSGQTTVPPADTGTSQPQTDSSHTDTAAVTGPSQVPATGAGDWTVLAVLLATATFAAVFYAQSKRRLLSYR